jgi:hypothetical protein
MGKRPQIQNVLYKKCEFIMSIFGNALDQVRVQDDSQPVTLQFNSTQRQVPYSLARGRGVGQLFAENSHSLGVYAARVANYVVNNEIVPSDFQLRPGETARATVNCENKG